MKKSTMSIVAKLSVLTAFVTVMFLCQGCLVSRCGMPNLTGVVYDSDTKLPLANCTVRVGNSKDAITTTDSNGHYELKEKRYLEFTWIGMEAPPLRFFLQYSKPGYELQVKDHGSKYGGGVGKGTHWKLKPLYLKAIGPRKEPD